MNIPRLCAHGIRAALLSFIVLATSSATAHADAPTRPPEIRPVARAMVSRVGGRTTASEIAVLRVRLEAVGTACFTAAIAPSSALERGSGGSMSLRFVIEPNGTLSRVTVASDEVYSPRLTTCLLSRIASVRVARAMRPGPMEVAHLFNVGVENNWGRGRRASNSDPR